jgi:septal ring factor EnvC (AmiA/AmiB activator)
MGKPTVEGVRKHWKGKLKTANEIIDSTIDTQANMLRGLRGRLQEAESERDKWKENSERGYAERRKVESAVADFERINKDYESSLEHGTEMMQELQARAADNADGMARALNIIDKLVERGKS